jgi:hypothetical protein
LTHVDKTQLPPDLVDHDEEEEDDDDREKNEEAVGVEESS